MMANELYHYGTKRHSGRYPWGSGENPYQSESWYFLNQVKELQKSGMSEKEIAETLGVSINTLRNRKSNAKNEQRSLMATEALRLKDKGWSNIAIGERLGVPESTVRNLLKPVTTERATAATNIANVLKDAVDKNEFVDVGKGVESIMGVSQSRLNAAVQQLKDQGYEVINVQIEQLGTDYKTTAKVLAPEGTTYKDVVSQKEKISLPIGSYSEDNGTTMLGIKDPVSVDPDRVAIKYAEDGGKEMDGVIQLRRGVEDISLGDARYAQVRIKVGDDKYLKGMAMYSDDMPDGVDLVFNTNKSKDVAKMDVLKSLKDDADNPFGATVRQKEYAGSDGETHLSALNIVNEEGDWNNWKKSIASQMLSKQPVSLAKKQLDKAYADKEEEYNEIMQLTNPAVKKKLLSSFSDDCDAAAVDLKAAAFPRQASKVILPFPDMKETEIYAPSYENGERVVLIRFPHGGKFEIPELTVNNKQPTAKATLGNAVDAVGINSKVAEVLSGADFDGDTVLVIPNNKQEIKRSDPLEKLKNFDPKEEYAAYEGMPKTGKDTGFSKPFEMGSVSNLITDMTIKGADTDEISRAVRHSMVVIDAEKHNLNWRQSYIDNGIAELKEKYQGGAKAGASTIISRASSTARVPQLQIRTGINKANTDPETGEKILKETGATYNKRVVDSEGNVSYETKQRLTKTTKMALAKDAYELVSSDQSPIEVVYADYANKMKALANQARKSYLETPSQKYDSAAKGEYQKEVASLDSKLEVALRNSPYERQAQIKANAVVKAKVKANPDMDKDEVKRLKSQALTSARAKVGAKKTKVEVTKKEWEAIQSGAISNSKLEKILANTDLDVIKSYATPRSYGSLTLAQIARAKALLKNHTQAEVASQLGVSVSTLYNAING